MTLSTNEYLRLEKAKRKKAPHCTNCGKQHGDTECIRDDIVKVMAVVPDD